MPSFQQAHTSMFWDMDELCKDQVLFTRKNRHEHYENFGMIEIQLPGKYKENFDVSKVLHICTYQVVVFLSIRSFIIIATTYTGTYTFKNIMK